MLRFSMIRSEGFVGGVPEATRLSPKRKTCAAEGAAAAVSSPAGMADSSGRGVRWRGPSGQVYTILPPSYTASEHLGKKRKVRMEESDEEALTSPMQAVGDGGGAAGDADDRAHGGDADDRAHGGGGGGVVDGARSFIVEC